jgi:hypothetical protein
MHIRTNACLVATWLVVGIACSSPAVDPHPVAPVVAVKDVLRVLSIACDLSEPQRSFVQVRYVAAPDDPPASQVLRTGDALAQHPEIVVASIDPGTVTFKFTDSSRAPEIVSCAEFDPKAALRGMEQPRHTTKIGPNRFWLGTEEVRQIRDGYADLLENEVQTRIHREPRSGRYDGIEILSIPPGRIVERHGFLDRDVVRSINGHPVVTTHEAISFVMANKDKCATWEVIVENKGKVRTLTFHSGARP